MAVHVLAALPHGALGAADRCEVVDGQVGAAASSAAVGTSAALLAMERARLLLDWGEAGSIVHADGSSTWATSSCNGRIGRRLSVKLAVMVAALGVVLGFPGGALAAPPALLSVGQQDRHPTAAFSAPGADFATIYFADKPDRATDGSFFQENVKHSASFTDDEIQRGAWLDANQIDPGTYYVMLRTSDFCYPEPDCTTGFSSVLTLEIPKPRPTYRASVGPVFRYIRVIYLDLTVRPLGERLPYRVCWRLKSTKRRCVTASVDGYSWNSSASDSLRIGMRGMAKRTTFTWYVNGRVVAAKTTNTTTR